ncbi:DUF4919 domain-containing protein [uncultured Formosa sp.]|uniref:DUF4919 domain-containing protein n=1 Tax=uncultured Formosa sp. TaxID=255435 RepID=UPI00261E3472|nr:DUF4919 domain-containing protein [uncultured Formosa sp.]
MKNIVSILCLLVSFLSFSQDWNFEKPNYETIEKNIQNKNSNLFYDSLMNRYQKSDSTMTLEEKRHLYYGYSFHKNYSPYSSSNYSDSLSVVLQKKKLEPIDLKNVITFTDSMLTKNPFDLRAMDYQMYALEKTGNTATYQNRVIQFRTTLDALMSSGNGASKEDAFYVIYTSHEYDLLGVIGFQFAGSQSLIEHYDYLTVAENKSNIEGLYFDVTPCLNSLNKMFEDD